MVKAIPAPTGIWREVNKIILVVESLPELQQFRFLRRNSACTCA